jgi:hypothetical protein
VGGFAGILSCEIARNELAPLSGTVEGFSRFIDPCEERFVIGRGRGRRMVSRPRPTRFGAVGF